MSNPPWTEAERLLALDLYLRRGLVGDEDPEVQELSQLMRALAPQSVAENYRNPNGVAMKLANFASLDPSSVSAGMANASAGDRETWEQFHSRPEAVRQRVEEIRADAVAAGFGAEAVHLLLRWQPKERADTVDRHREVCDEKGSVWWGQWTSRATRMATAHVERFKAQLAAGVATKVFFYRAGNPIESAEVWQTDMIDVTTDPDVVDAERLPSYYGPGESFVLVRVSRFKRLDPGEVEKRLRKWPELTSLATTMKGPATTIFVADNAPATPVPEPEPAEETMGLSLQELTKETLWTEERLAEVLDEITAGDGQVVLAGPPGTGKTWVAKALARFITQAESGHWRVVQFHSSYGYESFVEGLRPVAQGGGGIEFEVVPGTVRLVAAEATAEVDSPFVIVMDEMNRANLPRVLGELLYLFEYRDEPVDLMYTRGFKLPANIHFVGTMNTADRSIRSIDAALRRRLTIVECLPDTEILGRYYAAGRTNDVVDLIEGFETLNAQLTELLDRYHTIGHTFFMRPVMNNARLERVWDRQLKPLIDEYFFDQPDIASEFSFERFWTP